MAVVAAVLLAGVIAQRMATPPAARVVRSVQLTFSGQVNWPSHEAEFFPALATDGGRVYFTQMTENRHTLAQSSVGGGEVVTIRTPFNHALLLHVSPDGSRLLVRDFDWAQRESTLWVIPTIGGAPLRLGAVVAHDASWSPDGKRIVFARGEELYVVGSDGSEPRTLATTPGRAFWVRWSPDGARLRFTVVSPQGYQRLWEVSAEGRGLRPVPLGRREHDVDCCGEWSPDGRHFFFRRVRDDKGAGTVQELAQPRLGARRAVSVRRGC
jgi:Tol biopolymer transport system component